MVTDTDTALLDAIWKHSLNYGSRENMLELVAAHREAAVGEIVAWLRGPFVPDHSDEGGCPFDKAAAAIERNYNLEMLR